MNSPSDHYEPQIGGFRAFFPDPLPPSSLRIEGRLQTALSHADRAIGRLDGILAIIPDVDHFVSVFVHREAVLSSQIEGTHASLTDVLKYEALRERTATVDIQEVINYVAATHRGIAMLQEVPLSARLVKEVHRILMTGVRGGEPSKTAGEFRRSQNWIGGATPATARFVPPPWEEAQRAFAQLERFMNEPSPLPPLINAGLLHAQFETIHPFLDGNGRTGRLLISFWLIANQMLSAPVLYPSLYLKQEQSEYIRRLDAIRADGDWEGWLLFFLGALTAAADEAFGVARSIVGLRKEDEALIVTHMGRRTAPALALLQQLYATPIVSSTFVGTTIDIPRQTASALLEHFARIGILRETTGNQKRRRFAYHRYLMLFPGADDRS